MYNLRRAGALVASQAKSSSYTQNTQKRTQLRTQHTERHMHYVMICTQARLDCTAKRQPEEQPFLCDLTTDAQDKHAYDILAGCSLAQSAIVVALCVCSVWVLVADIFRLIVFSHFGKPVIF